MYVHTRASFGVQGQMIALNPLYYQVYWPDTGKPALEMHLFNNYPLTIDPSSIIWSPEIFHMPKLPGSYPRRNQ